MKNNPVIQDKFGVFWYNDPELFEWNDSEFENKAAEFAAAGINKYPQRTAAVIVVVAARQRCITAVRIIAAAVKEKPDTVIMHRSVSPRPHAGMIIVIALIVNKKRHCLIPGKAH